MDIVFDEDKSWDWNKKYEEAILCDLEWGDKDVVIEEEHDVLVEEEHEALVDEEHEAWQNNADTPNEDNIFDPTFESPEQRRCRRPPLWMEDYETGEGFS